MKKVVLSSLSLLILLSVVIFTGCQKDDSNENPAITVQDNGSLTQNVFADETHGKSGVTFTTTGAWTSNISETAAKKAAAPAWISIDPDHGDKAGNYTISISLEPNYTGTDRTATIRIVCEDTEITVSVTQKNVKEDGKTPVDITNLTIDKSELSLSVGDTLTLHALIEPDSADYKTLVWSSSNTAVATVSEIGKVTAVGEGGANILVTITKQNDGTVASVCAVTVKKLPSLTELSDLCDQSYGELWEAWLQIDNGYSTYTSRLSLTQASPFLYEFWEKSYECISYSNLLIEQSESSNIPESDKTSYKGKAFALRATVYFYLKILFGGVPLVSSTETLINPIARSTVQETLEFIYDDIDRAEELSIQSFTAIFGLVREVVYLQENDGINHALDALRRKMDSGDFVFRDINGDGVINSADENTETVLIYLLLAEAYLKTENMTEAAQYLNRINTAYGQAPSLPSPASANDIQNVIRQKYSALSNAGVKYLNAVRWGDTQSWGYRALMPIPLKVMQENSSLTQNSGW